jgi:putative MATE family efflux protein
MLSFYSVKAVAAVGLINQFAFFMQLLYLMVAVGSSILISQNLGARMPKEAGRIALGSLALGFAFSLLLSLIMCCFASGILSCYKLDAQVCRYAWQFLFIYSAGSMFMAIGMIQSTILRTHGHSREPMVVNIFANIINVTGNYFFIFGPFGVPKLGVVGVALSTVGSQIIACGILTMRLRAHRDIELPLREIFHVPRNVYRRILSVGIPTAGENLSYNIGQMIVMAIISSMGTGALAATVYANTVLRFVFITSISIGNGAQIKVGYWVGAGKPDDAYKKVFAYFFSGFCISFFLALSLFVFQSPIMAIFTKDRAILHLTACIFLVSLFLEPGRNFNIIIIPALKGAGDIKFPVYMGMLLMWGIGVLFAYVFGKVFSWGIIGVWIALACDEWIRGTIMFFRWRNKKWKTKSLVKTVRSELPPENQPQSMV